MSGGRARWGPGGVQVDPTWPQALVAWFARSRRALPWRVEPRDPYRVWVSEVMLQQTRVETVLRYYGPFLAKFPDPRTLAEAPEDALMKAWEGLGYYRRARLLQRGAAHVVARGMPRSFEEWLEVPGVGEYTAGAIASLTAGERVAAVDGNVLRVWARITASREDVGLGATKARAASWVLAHQPASAAGPFNEALMELGARVCSPGAPRCGECPVASACAGRALAGELPVKGARVAAREMEVALAVVRRGDRFLLEKRSSGLLAGTWGFPWVEGGAHALAARVAGLTGSGAQVGAEVATGTHVFTHRRWRMRAFEVRSAGSGGDWKRPGEVALGSAHRKILDLLVES